MAKTKIVELHEVGQSAWLDYISRPLIEQGKLKNLIDSGLRGITSNPTIFDKAISGGSDYDIRIRVLADSGSSTFEIYDDLTVKDIQDAADILRPVYEESKGLDGYVSLEVNPKLAYNTEDTVKEARRLWAKVNRPNLMLKIPATGQGFEAIEELLALGMNVNATLIFSLKQYEHTAHSYIKGIKRFSENGGNLSLVRSVASVFVSRIDSLIDKKLDEAKAADTEELKGKAAVANSQLIYEQSLNIFSSDEFKLLEDKGANIQRVLWASTSTKNPAYSDIKYVSELIGRDTVNTLPESTFKAFLDHGEARIALSSHAHDAKALIEKLLSLGIDVNKVCEDLLSKGVISFENSFESLLGAIEAKRDKLSQRIYPPR